MKLYKFSTKQLEILPTLYHFANSSRTVGSIEWTVIKKVYNESNYTEYQRDHLNSIRTKYLKDKREKSDIGKMMWDSKTNELKLNMAKNRTVYPGGYERMYLHPSRPGHLVTFPVIP